MRRLSRLLSGAALAAAGLAPAAGADDLKPALQARTEFRGLDGRLIAAVSQGEPVILRVAITSGYTADPPAGLTLFGWLRRVDGTDLPCGQAAESFLRTGRLPTGTIFLNDPVIGVLTEDRAFVVSDPEFSLASANLLGAARFRTMPAALAADPLGRRFLLALPEEGRVVAVDATGRARTLAEGLAAPRDLAPLPDGAVAVLDGAGRLLRLGGDGTRQTLAKGLGAIRPAPEPGWLAALEEDRALVVDAAGGRIAHAVAQPGLADAALLAGFDAPAPFALALVAGRSVTIRYLDAPGAGGEIALPSRATRLAAAPGGRVLIAWSPAGGPVHVIDVARGRLVRSMRADSAVSEVAFSDATAFVMLESQTHVGALDLDAVARGAAAEFREIQIGTAAPPPGHARQLLAPLWPMEGMLAVHAETYQGYRIMDGSVMGDAPAMTATSLRGGVPRLVATLDRSFREGPRGVFETVASLPGPGRFELVATTGLGALSFCTEVPVAEPEAPDAADPAGRIAIRAEGEAVRLAVTGPDGAPRPGLSGRVTFSALAGGWRAHAPLQTDAEGLSDAAYALPRLGAIVIRLEADGPDRFPPILLESDR